jgi:hypothetical protein
MCTNMYKYQINYACIYFSIHWKLPLSKIDQSDQFLSSVKKTYSNKLCWKIWLRTTASRIICLMADEVHSGTGWTWPVCSGFIKLQIICLWSIIK